MRKFLFPISATVIGALLPAALGQQPPPPRPSAAKGATPAPKPASPPRYFVVPLHGVVGKQVTARKLKEAMGEGLKDPATILVLDIDSPGGLISECEKIIALLGEEKDRRTIAFVRNAYSAAAMISIACDEIYLQELAAIGAASAIITGPATPAPGVPDKPGLPGRPAREERTGPPERRPRAPAPREPEPPEPQPGTPDDKDSKDTKDPEENNDTRVREAPEKIQTVWRSICRRAAELGGHNPLLAEAMADRDIRLRLVAKDGDKVVEQYLDAKDEDYQENRIIKTSGKLLTLTAREAVNCGLAAGIAQRINDLEGRGPGLAGWKPVNNRGERIMALHKADVEKAEKSFRTLLFILEDSLRNAIASDPSARSYNTDLHGDLLQAERDALSRLSQACANHLRNCEVALQKISDLGSKHPFLEPEARGAQEVKEKIRMVRDRMQKTAQRYRVQTGVGL
jgi:ATP-dependent protease ClpP protease subunit